MNREWVIVCLAFVGLIACIGLAIYTVVSLER